VISNSAVVVSAVSLQSLSPDWPLEAGPVGPRFDLLLSRPLQAGPVESHFDLLSERPLWAGPLGSRFDRDPWELAAA
jgi:hypothetical protein